MQRMLQSSKKVVEVKQEPTLQKRDTLQTDAHTSIHVETHVETGSHENHQSIEINPTIDSNHVVSHDR